MAKLRTVKSFELGVRGMALRAVGEGGTPSASAGVLPRHAPSMDATYTDNCFLGTNCATMQDVGDWKDWDRSVPRLAAGRLD
jgi:hypothetical protein